MAANDKTKTESKPETVVFEFYKSISFGLYDHPNYERMSELFLEGASVCVPDSESKSFTAFTIPAFVEYAREHIWTPEDSRLGFIEEEVSGETFQLKGMAHHLSRYGARTLVDEQYSWAGVNSFQLARANGVWKIASLIWERKL